MIETVTNLLTAAVLAVLTYVVARLVQTIRIHTGILERLYPGGPDPEEDEDTTAARLGLPPSDAVPAAVWLVTDAGTSEGANVFVVVRGNHIEGRVASLWRPAAFDFTRWDTGSRPITIRAARLRLGEDTDLHDTALNLRQIKAGDSFTLTAATWNLP